MLRKKIFALCLAALFAASAITGCAQVGADDIVAMVGETPIYRWTYDSYLTQQLALYGQYADRDITKPEHAADFEKYKEFRIEELVGEAAIREEARKLGLDQLTPEEEQQVNQAYQDYYDARISRLVQQFGEDAAGRKKADDAFYESLKQSNLTPERVRAGMRNAVILNKFIDHLLEGEPVLDEEVRASYDSSIEYMQQQCAEDPNWFGENYSDPPLYAPEGYRDTARITLYFTPKHLSDITVAANAAETAQKEYVQAANLHGEDSTQAQKLIPKMDQTDEEFRKVLDRCYQELIASIEPIREDVLAGSDFIRIMEEKSNDTHLISYFVTDSSDHVEASYLEAALKLEKPGDISEPIRLEQGVCIIKYMEDVEPGVRPFEQVKDALKEKMEKEVRLNAMLTLQTEYGDKAREADIVTIHENKLK